MGMAPPAQFPVTGLNPKLLSFGLPLQLLLRRVDTTSGALVDEFRTDPGEKGMQESSTSKKRRLLR